MKGAECCEIININETQLNKRNRQTFQVIVLGSEARITVFPDMVALNISRKVPGKHLWQYIIFDFINNTTSLRMFSLEFSQIF